MSVLHCRGCDCLECCPGYPAAAPRVYRTKRRTLRQKQRAAWAAMVRVRKAKAARV